MNKDIFERNMLALSKTDPLLCTRLSSALTSTGVYRFLPSRSGEPIPALIDPSGAARPLHSTVDPRREGDRLVSTLSGKEGYLVFLGLGGAFAAEAALKQKGVWKIFVVEYGCNGAAELLSSREYISLLQDPRFRLLVDPGTEELEASILESYIPALHGGIRVFPLRARAEGDKRFAAAAETIKQAVDGVSRDYSVQAYFGKRWFCNIIRNIFRAEGGTPGITPITRAAICAAGPSLDEQMPLIQGERREKRRPFLIAADTSLPALLKAGIEPDAVISIDCQQISCQHFFGGIPASTRLFLDLASPPTAASLTENRFFFSGGHPLSRYISRNWRALPVLDTSGANVTYAALSLAENLGAEQITLYGADFSYPQGKTYARGTYLYPYFEKKQTRFAGMETQHSAFLYRGVLDRGGDGSSWYYESPSLRFYREGLEKKAAHSPARLLSVPGRGPALHFPADGKTRRKELTFYAPGPSRGGALAFLRSYRKELENTMSFTDPSPAAVTILPAAAVFRKNNPEADLASIFEELKAWCLEELYRVLAAGEHFGR